MTVLVSECAECGAWFHDGPCQAGVCPHCGHENTFPDE